MTIVGMKYRFLYFLFIVVLSGCGNKGDDIIMPIKECEETMLKNASKTDGDSVEGELVITKNDIRSQLNKNSSGNKYKAPAKCIYNWGCYLIHLINYRSVKNVLFETAYKKQF